MEIVSRLALPLICATVCSWAPPTNGGESPQSTSYTSHPTAETSSIAAAVRAFEQYDIPQSRRIYEGLLTSSAASLDEKITAYRSLANYDWKFDQNAKRAIHRLDEALPIATAKSAVYVQRGLVELEVGQVAAARRDADDARLTSGGSTDLVEADLLFAKSILAHYRTRSELPPSGDRHFQSDLRLAAKYLDQALDLQPGRSDLSESLLRLSLLFRDGPMMMRAWMSYFFFANAGAVSDTMHEPYLVLDGLARHWHGNPLTSSQRRDLALALARSHFYDLAAVVASNLKMKNTKILELIAYQQFLEGVEAINQRFYPLVANGLKNYSDDYDAALCSIARLFLVAIHEPVALDGVKMDDFFDHFFQIIRAHFGAEGYVGDTVGYHGLLAGHGVYEESRKIEQFGFSGDFHYVSIDRMFSRDFTSWYGTTNVGGWGTESTMYQVRSAYLTDPYKRLSWVVEPAEHAKILAKIEGLERDDLARCAADRYADPSAVALRIKLRESERMYSNLFAQGLRGQNVALAFVSETLRLNVEATVFAHEGRHALDQRFFKSDFDRMSDDERELRAKFSEVEFSSNPKLALTGSILGASVDESTGHGLANRRFRILLINWMDAHAREIAGLDPNRPMIMQVDLLTNNQIVDIVGGVDRMKPGESKSK